MVQQLTEERDRNKVLNPSFESGTSGVVAPGTVTVTINTYGPMVVAGTKALHLTVGAGATAATSIYQSVAAVAGEYLAFGAHVRYSPTSGGSRYYQQAIEFYDSGSLLLGSAVLGPVFYGVTNNEGGDRHVLSGLAPAGAVTARLHIFVFADAAGSVAPADGSIFTTDAWSGISGASQAYVESVAASFYDGDTPDDPDWLYSWAGTAGASESIREAVLDNVLAEPLADGPWAGVTIRGLTAGGTDVLTLWRTSEGVRLPVRGAKGLEAIDSAFVIDYEVPLGRPVSYEVEFLEGPDAGTLANVATVTIESACGYLHDPLDPRVPVPVWATRAPNGEPVLAPEAFAELARRADVSSHRIIGGRQPVAIGGQRQAAGGVNLSVLADAETQNTRLRDMTNNSTVLVARLLPGWLNGAFPPVAHVALPEVIEAPVAAGRGLRQGFGQHLTRWSMVGDIVRPSSAAVLVALFTYQDVEDLFATYEQKQIQAGGGSYLDDLKQPLG